MSCVGVNYVDFFCDTFFSLHLNRLICTHLYLGYGNVKYLVLDWQLIVNDNFAIICRRLLGTKWKVPSRQ